MNGTDLSAELFGAPAARDLTADLFGGAAPMSRTDKVLRGVVDPIEGGAQLLTKLLPQGVVDAGNSANNWLADKTGLVAKIPEAGMDGLIQQNEAAYQAKRAAAGESGFDGYRLLGNATSPANMALAARTANLVTRAPALVNTMLSGGLTALANPVTQGDYWEEKAKQGGMGMAGGALAQGLTSAAARVISPNASMNPQLQLLRQEGVRPTVGQSLGGWANRMEEKLQSLPIVGDAISAARQGAGQDLGRAAINRSHPSEPNCRPAWQVMMPFCLRVVRWAMPMTTCCLAWPCSRMRSLLRPWVHCARWSIKVPSATAPVGSSATS